MEILKQLPRGKILLEETEDENRPRCKKDVVKRQEERIVYRLQVMKKKLVFLSTENKKSQTWVEYALNMAKKTAGVMNVIFL